MTMKRIGPAILFSTLVLFAVTVLSAPSGDSDSSSSEESSEDTELIYVQRQNGSQNFRLQMSDVMLILAPAEALLSIGGTDLLELGDDKATVGHGCGADDKLKCKSHSVKRYCTNSYIVTHINFCSFA